MRPKGWRHIALSLYPARRRLSATAAHGHSYRRRSLSLILILINPVFLDRTVDGGGALVLLLLRQSLQQAPAQESVNGTDSAHV